MRTLAHRYLAYNLIFSSDLECPELPLVVHLAADRQQDKADVHIRYGQVPEVLNNPTRTGGSYQANPDQFLLSVKDVGRYLVQHGNEIIIEPATAAEPNDVRVFMLGSAFGALLHQRQTLVIHAGAVHTDKGAVLFAGPSGIGKSTLLSEMLCRGYPMMVDDVCAVVLDQNNQPQVLPGYPRTRLWADSAEKLNICTENLVRTRPQMEKFERQLPGQFWSEPAPLRHIYTLNTNDDTSLSVTRLPAISTFSTILLNTYRRIFLDGLEMRQPHFELASAVACSVGVSRVVRPSGTFQLNELADLIEEDLAA